MENSTGSESMSSSDENMFPYASRRRASKKTNGLPIKMLIDEEMSRRMESKRHSPSIIARLMGLDALPAEQPINKQRKRNENRARKMSSFNLQEQCLSCEDHSFQMSMGEQQEFKDVYEVLVTPKVEKHKTWHVSKGTLSLKKTEVEMEFIKQKFMDAKRLSSDEKLRNTKEFDEALEALNCNADLLLNFLQEPNSLFAKHLQELQASSQPPMSGQIAVLKPSNFKQYEKDGTNWNRERKNESRKHARKDVSKSRVEGRNDTGHLPTTIVVLKPNSGKKIVKTSTQLRSLENFHYSYGNHGEFGRSRSQELPYENADRQKLYVDVDNVTQKPKSSRQIAREIAKHMRYNASNSFLEVSGSRSKGHLADERSFNMSEKAASISCSETFPRSPGHFVDLNSRYKSCSSHSNESSMCREATRRLSERWKMTHRPPEVGLGSHSSNTLREMLALSDKDTAETCLDSAHRKNGPHDSLNDNMGLGRCGPSPLGISSRDGWKERPRANLMKSRSLGSSSSLSKGPKPSNMKREYFGNDNSSMLEESPRRNIKSRRWKSQSYIFVGEDDHLLLEVDNNSNELKDRYRTKYLFEENSPHLGGLADTETLTKHVGIDGMEGADIVFNSCDESLPQPSVHAPVVKDDAKTSLCSQNNSIVKGTFVDTEQKDSLLSNPHMTGLECPQTSKNGEQPSPVSVLEPQDEEEKSSPDCFERVSADLQGLRMQLQLLKLESTEAGTGGSEINNSCEEETLLESSGLDVGDFLVSDRTDESRDLSYLLDALIQSGFYRAGPDTLISAWYSPEFPIGSSVFENLETKYGELQTWPKAERKLWFDCINSGLAEILAPCVDLHPWVKPRERRVGLVWGGEALVEELCKFLIRQEKEGSDENSCEKVLLREMGWLILGDDIDKIGREIEGYLMDGLLREIVSEFMSF
ncbi:hypothetical protein QJS10_CPA03g01458 [Acorus calamus]|uniref:DUF4378 domain-containing protein n=1 Tax=Acorus calamus TaxID=4465 RepID=A0AAV9F7Y8_ACOCL|nr:hypothetical protein QJS10_CPA03g01458 [Acorus calamus]